MLRHNNRHRTSPLGLGDKQCVDPRYQLFKCVEKFNHKMETGSVKCRSNEMLHLTYHNGWKSVAARKQKHLFYVKLQTWF